MFPQHFFQDVYTSVLQHPHNKNDVNQPVRGNLLNIWKPAVRSKTEKKIVYFGGKVDELSM